MLNLVLKLFLRNLFQEAVGRGGKRIRITTSAIDTTPKGQVLFEIKVTGIGIAGYKTKKLVPNTTSGKAPKSKKGNGAR